MKTVDVTLDAQKNGGKVISFQYSHSLNELVGSWSASVAGGTFKAGNSISFSNVMKNGIIMRAYKDSTGLWHVEGKDAGVKLMKSTPNITMLPEGSAKTVIQNLASTCGVTLDMQEDGLDSFNVRSIVSGSTCAEAILELAMFSGMIAYINNNGQLVVTKPHQQSHSFTGVSILDDSGSDIDLEGYATHVIVSLTRRKWEKQEEAESSGNTLYKGTTPSRSPDSISKSGSFSNGSYSMTTLDPFGVISKCETSITENGVTIKTEEDHDYDYKSKVVWRDNQEYVLFAFVESGYTLTRTTTGSYDGESFIEKTTETMSRSFSSQDATVGIPDDWLGRVNMVGTETITRTTTRQGGKAPTADMPSYSPPYDSKITRRFSRERGGRGLLCVEDEERYEARQVGSIAPVKLNGELIPHFLQGSNLVIQSHSTPQWVLVKTRRSFYEQYDGDGECVISTRSEYCDDGAEWLIANAMTDTGDEDLNTYQKSYAKFSQQASGLEVSVGSSALPSVWHFLELPGRIKVKVSDADVEAAIGNYQDWYNNGEYVWQSVCPHYNSTNKTCNVYILDADELDSPDEACSHYKGTSNWRFCDRALKALKKARELDAPQVEIPVIATASRGGSAVGYRRDIYIDDILEDDKAQEIANTIADNILTVKGNKGFRKTITIPYSTDYHPDGVILEVSHNWENLQTSITYKEEGSIPDCLISQSVAGIAAFVSARETARLNVPQYGKVTEAPDNGFVNVVVGNSTIECTTKLTSLDKDDIVLVAFPAGNKLRGQVIGRL